MARRLIIGGWALMAPRHVIEMAFLPEFHPAPGATGAAAMLPFAVTAENSRSATFVPQTFQEHVIADLRIASLRCY